MQFRYQPPYLIKNLNTRFKGTVNARYTSKTVCLSFFCKFIKFTHTIQHVQWGFLQKFLFGHFYVFRELFCLLQHILATVQPKIHLNTKFEILPFGWTKCPKTEPFFFFWNCPTASLLYCQLDWVYSGVYYYTIIIHVDSESVSLIPDLVEASFTRNLAVLTSSIFTNPVYMKQNKLKWSSTYIHIHWYFVHLKRVKNPG